MMLVVNWCTFQWVWSNCAAYTYMIHDIHNTQHAPFWSQPATCIMCVYLIVIVVISDFFAITNKKRTMPQGNIWKEIVIAFDAKSTIHVHKPTRDFFFLPEQSQYRSLCGMFPCLWLSMIWINVAQLTHSFHYYYSSVGPFPVIL